MAKSKKTQEETPVVEDITTVEETTIQEETPAVEETIVSLLEEPTIPSFSESGMSAKDYARIYKKRPY